MPHLPYAFGDDDEFLHPKHGWLLLARAITLDNWLSWRTALPRDHPRRGQLTAEAAANIAALAEAVHAIHRRLPGYRALGDNPFHVIRWWDPARNSGRQSGTICCFRIEGFSSHDILEHAAACPELCLDAVTGLYVEASLVSPEALSEGHPGPPQSDLRPDPIPCSRTRQTPRPRKPGPAPLSRPPDPD
jgi:hypothetical protein